MRARCGREVVGERVALVITAVERPRLSCATSLSTVGLVCAVVSSLLSRGDQYPLARLPPMT